MSSSIQPVSYSMLNGEGGSWTYYDESYDGVGDNTSGATFLSGGTGDLTDGVKAELPWDQEESVSDGPYVGWKTIEPIIDFQFGEVSHITEVTIYVADANGHGRVYAPDQVNITMGGVTRSFNITDPPGSGPTAITFSDLNLTGSSLELQLLDSGNSVDWIFLSEVEFTGGQSQVFPVSYSMRNGEGGSWTYFDESYDGTGDNTSGAAFLSGGTGDLTDGIVADGSWFQVEHVSDGPYVGWKTIEPDIDFQFDGITNINEVTIYVDDANNYGRVNTPDQVNIIMNGVMKSFSIVDPLGAGPLSITFSDLNLAGSSLELQLRDSRNSVDWIFLSEVEFKTGDSDTILGDIGNNVLIGGDGDDIINGLTGYDRFEGGGGNDTFVLESNSGFKTIADFVSGQDLFGLGSGLQFTDLSFIGSNIIVSATNETLATITGFDATTLNASDFTLI
ncbi:hypothetical protein D0962_20605 [Leptolyngbyaceae cyanobacterium CCMR0082]|uniref:Discoidin domain-containing protein n=1 Tax=Adonisia turfae CCMR0082 TaxID=2304604 RepID=A0A6M0SA56_9CYAN|nr:hypothetical protein [Adonisia turfae]NEZ65146.1 hypothetical protein [Adonisia turfae CCMR0082]